MNLFPEKISVIAEPEPDQRHQDELDLRIEQMITSIGGGNWECVTCGYQVSWGWWRGGHVTRCSPLIGCDCQGKKGDARRHVEARHVEDMSILCSHCAKPFKTRESLRKHVERTHRIIN